MVLFGGAAHGVAVAVPHTVAGIDEIQMCIDLQDVDGGLVGVGADAGDVDRMVAADDHGQGVCRQRRAHACLDIGVGFFGVGVDDVGVAHVDDAHAGAEIGGVVFVIIGAGVAEAEERRGLADGAGPKRAPGRYWVPASKGAPRMATSALSVAQSAT